MCDVTNTEGNPANGNTGGHQSHSRPRRASTANAAVVLTRHWRKCDGRRKFRRCRNPAQPNGNHTQNCRWQDPRNGRNVCRNTLASRQRSTRTHPRCTRTIPPTPVTPDAKGAWADSSRFPSPSHAHQRSRNRYSQDGNRRNTRSNRSCRTRNRRETRIRNDRDRARTRLQQACQRIQGPVRRTMHSNEVAGLPH